MLQQFSWGPVEVGTVDGSEILNNHLLSIINLIKKGTGSSYQLVSRNSSTNRTFVVFSHGFTSHCNVEIQGIVIHPS